MLNERSKRIKKLFDLIDKDSNLSDNELALTICANTECSWRTAREYVKIARIKHGTL